MRARFTNYLEVFHSTDTIEEAKSIKKNGFKPGTRGRGMAEGNLFSALVKPIPQSFYDNYGDVTIKFLIPLHELKNGYLIWDESTQKKVWSKTKTPQENFDEIFLPGFKSSLPKKLKEKNLLDLNFIDGWLYIEQVKHNEDYSDINIEKFRKTINQWENKHADIFDNPDSHEKEWDQVEELWKKLPNSANPYYMELINSKYGKILEKFDLIKTRKKYIENPHIIYRPNHDSDELLKLGYKGFCGEGRFDKGIIYFGSYDLSILNPISYSINRGKTFKKL